MPAGAAKPQQNKVKRTATPIEALAMDGPRVAYVSGGRIRVWNVVSGATSVVKGNYPSVKDRISGFDEIAISGNRLAWIRSVYFWTALNDGWITGSIPHGWVDRRTCSEVKKRTWAAQEITQS